MRRAARIDANQPEIVAYLRACGASVQPLHMVGGGCPDLACGYQGRTVLIEVKDGSQPPSRRKLTPDEQRWHEEWRGDVEIVESIAAPFAREAALARKLGTDKGMQIGLDGVQLLGGHGFTKEHPVERWYRDLRAIGVAEGVVVL